MGANAAAGPQQAEQTRQGLNPLYGACAFQRFDQGYGYQSHHWKCVQTAPRIGAPGVDALGLDGVEVRGALDPGHAARLATRLTEADRSLSAADLERSEVEAALGAVLSPETCATLHRYFLTEFAVIYFGLQLDKAPAGDGRTAAPSQLWHCDFGPTKFLKILVYLNGEEAHDGATEILDLRTTRAFKQLGYVFCPTERRRADLSGLAAEHGLAYAPRALRPDAGQAIVFEPQALLHRGIPPTRGARCLLDLVLIPWAEPWDRFLDKHFTLLTENRACGFPKVT